MVNTNDINPRQVSLALSSLIDAMKQMAEYYEHQNKLIRGDRRQRDFIDAGEK